MDRISSSIFSSSFLCLLLHCHLNSSSRATSSLSLLCFFLFSFTSCCFFSLQSFFISVWIFLLFFFSPLSLFWEFPFVSFLLFSFTFHFPISYFLSLFLPISHISFLLIIPNSTFFSFLFSSSSFLFFPLFTLSLLPLITLCSLFLSFCALYSLPRFGLAPPPV